MVKTTDPKELQSVATGRFLPSCHPKDQISQEARLFAWPSCCFPMRIVSLVPSATETLFALGVGDEVAAVTHECDHPAAALDLPKITRDILPPGLEAGEIDRAVRALTEEGRSIYELDAARMRALQPDLIVTQALCAVCAVSYDEVRELARDMDPQPQVVALDPHTLGEVLGDVRTLAEAT